MIDERPGSRLGHDHVHGRGGQDHPLGGAADGDAQGVVVGQQVGKRRQAAHRVERLPGEGHRRPEAAHTRAHPLGDQDRRQEAVVHEHRPQPGPDVVLGSPDIETRHQPHRGILQRSHDGVEIPRTDPDVAVGDHQDIMPGGREHVQHVADLEVGAAHTAVNHQRQVAVGKLPDQAPDGRDRGIGGLADAEDHLQVAAPPLLAKGAQVLVEPGLVAAERLQDGDRGPCGKAGIRLPNEPAHLPGSQQHVGSPAECHQDQRVSQEIRPVQ